VHAALLPNASGRYIVVAESLTLLEISKLLHIDEFGIPDKLPKRETGKALMWLIAPLVGMRRSFVERNVGYPIYYNNERSKLELGMHYRPPTETFNDHIRQIVADGLL
jgi:hypothetical protein